MTNNSNDNKKKIEQLGIKPFRQNGLFKYNIPIKYALPEEALKRVLAYIVIILRSKRRRNNHFYGTAKTMRQGRG